MNKKILGRVKKRPGKMVGFVRQAGFDKIQQEQMVLKYIDTHSSVKRSDVVELCHLTASQAYHLLKKLQKDGVIVQKGKMRHAFYTRK